jgi:glyoxylase-like metal-dependent hydrolase (beta-lactamase superfamily II)
MTGSLEAGRAAANSRGIDTSGLVACGGIAGELTSTDSYILEGIMEHKIIRIDLEGVNSYLVNTGDGFILFDTGGHLIMDKQFTNRRDKLEEGLQKAGCAPGSLKLVVLTHGDSDHTANAAYIREKYHTRLALHREDLFLVDHPELEKVMGTFRYRSIVFKLVFCVMKGLIRKSTVKILKDFESFQPDLFLEEGFDLTQYGFDAKVLHTPGHTPGSVGILTSNGDLIAGDTFTNTGKPASAPNAFDFKALGQSVRRLNELGVKTVYPGHGEPYTL